MNCKNWQYEHNDHRFIRCIILLGKVVIVACPQFFNLDAHIPPYQVESHPTCWPVL